MQLSKIEFSVRLFTVWSWFKCELVLYMKRFNHADDIFVIIFTAKGSLRFCVSVLRDSGGERVFAG